MRILLIIILFATIFNGGPVFGQSEADNLISSIKNRTDQILSFEVDAIIKVDVDFINIKDRKVKIKYEAPDKYSFDAKGLILLPKNGVQMEYMALFNQNHTAIMAGTEIVDQVQTDIVKIIPESIDSDIILAQIWIDPINVRIMRMKTFTRSSGSYVINFEYSTESELMPDRLVVIFEISNMSIPVKMMNDFTSNSSSKTDSLPEEARVIIEYSNYQISLKQTPK